MLLMMLQNLPDMASLCGIALINMESRIKYTYLGAKRQHKEKAKMFLSQVSPPRSEQERTNTRSKEQLFPQKTARHLKKGRFSNQFSFTYLFLHLICRPHKRFVVKMSSFMENPLPNMDFLLDIEAAQLEHPCCCIWDFTLPLSRVKHRPP